jgi:hypothetical protein
MARTAGEGHRGAASRGQWIPFRESPQAIAGDHGSADEAVNSQQESGRENICNRVNQSALWCVLNM